MPESSASHPRIFAVTFHSGTQLLQLHCRRFGLSEIDGLYEIAEICFSDARILLHDEETLRTELRDVERILLPRTALVRIDEMKPEFGSFEGPKLLGHSSGKLPPQDAADPRRRPQ
jgi:hypothetical protein